MKSSSSRTLRRTDGCALRVYTDLPQVEGFLTRTEFIISKCYDPFSDFFLFESHLIGSFYLVLV